MNLVERFRISALVLVLFAMVAFCIGVEDITLLLVTLPLGILSWYVTEGPRGWTVSRSVQNVLLIVLLAWAGFRLANLPEASETMGLLGRFVQWLLLVKLYGKKTRRDYAQLISLSAVLVMAGTLQTVNFSFAIAAFVYSALVVWTVLLFQLWAARERIREARAKAIEDARSAFGSAAVVSLTPPVQAVFGRSLRWQFRSVGAAASILGIVLSLVIFVIFPRELADGDRRFGRLRSMRVGFSEEVQLFTGNRINDSEREVFSVSWSDAKRGDVMKFADPLYLRGSVQERYNARDRRWERSERRRISVMTSAAKEDAGEEFEPLTPAPIDERFQTYVQRVTMRSLASEVIFAAWAPIGVACDEERSIDVDPTTLLLRARRSSGTGYLLRYALKVQPYANEASLRALARDARRPPEQVSFPVQSVVDYTRQLAERLDLRVDAQIDPAEDATNDALWQRNRQISRSLAEWLQGNEFEYTTDLGPFVPISGEDPIYSFLARYKFGHCEYFASALVAMCQSLGIESRIVTGYLAIEYDDSSNEYIVRDSNAHAWVEVRVSDYAWMRLDPTPVATLQSLKERRRGWADNFRWFYDRMEFYWNSRFVTFDSSTQAALAESLTDVWQRAFRNWFDEARSALQRLNAFFAFGQAGTAWLGLVGFAVVLAGLAVDSIRRRVQRLRRATGLSPREASTRRILKEFGFWLDALEALRRRGVSKPESRSPREHVLQLAAVDPPTADTFGELVEIFYAARYAGRPLSDADEQRVKELVANLQPPRRSLWRLWARRPALGQ